MASGLHAGEMVEPVKLLGLLVESHRVITPVVTINRTQETIGKVHLPDVRGQEGSDSERGVSEPARRQL